MADSAQQGVTLRDSRGNVLEMHVCGRDGCLVADTEQHDRWHESLDKNVSLSGVGLAVKLPGAPGTEGGTR